jgi:penicillin-binding protein 2
VAAWPWPARWCCWPSGLLRRASSGCRWCSTSYYRTRAEDNRISLVPIVPNRGLIVDRNGTGAGAQLLGLHPGDHAGQGGRPGGRHRRTGRLVDIQPKDRKRFKKLLEESKNFESLPIRTRLSDEEVARFIAQRYRFPGVEIKARLFRQYPQGSFASHAMGYIGRINDRDLERHREQRGGGQLPRHRPHRQDRARSRSYEFELHGITGFEQVEVDAGGRAVRLLRRTRPCPATTSR